VVRAVEGSRTMSLAMVLWQNEFLAFSVVIVILSLVGLVVWVWMLIWVYRDAKSRGKEPILWVLIVAVLGLVGFIIYYVLRNEPERPAYAPGYYYPPPQYQYPYQQYPQQPYPQQPYPQQPYPQQQYPQQQYPQQQYPQYQDPYQQQSGQTPPQH
jgi:hypothetical protein